MVAAITTTGKGLTLIMRPTTMGRNALALGSAAAEIPRTLAGFPIIVSSNSPAQITLADLAEVAFAQGDIDVELARGAAIEMESEPASQSTDVGSPTSPVATSVVSLFQTNSVALKVIRYV